MKKSLGQASVCLGAVVGAGFASGRELMSFFTLSGVSSWAGILLSVCVMGVLCYFLLDQRQLFASWYGQVFFSLLLCVTSGAMTAAGGELFKLLWPFSGGYPLGVGITLGLALILAKRGLRALQIAGQALIPGLAAIFVLGARLPAFSGAAVEGVFKPVIVFNALSYAGLNMALAAPALSELALSTHSKDRWRTSAIFTVLLLFLMILGNTVLLRHPELKNAPLPMVALLRSYGMIGFYLCASGLYLAVFSTLLAAIRGICHLWQPLFHRWTLLLCAAASLVFALNGFIGIVDILYPLLGWSCVILMLQAMISAGLKKRLQYDTMPKKKLKGAFHEPK
ncbi:MAG: hypothetical protein IJF65_04575 [Clostridia bacterium]|nr:hypothetical protein [Clostridia bacterium]